MSFRPISPFSTAGYTSQTSPFRSYLRSAPQETAPPAPAPTPTPAPGASPVIPALAGYGAYEALGGGGVAAAPTIASSAPSILGAGGTGVASATPEAIAAGQGVLLNPATGEAVATAAPLAAGGAAATSPWALSGIGSTGNFLLPIAGAVGIGDLAMRRPGGFSGAAQGAASGAAIGSYFPGYGTVIGAGVGALYGGLNKASGKDKDQLQRDAMRQALIDRGLLAQDYKITLANGQVFDMGKDGGAAIQNWDGQTSRPYYQWDTTSPLSHQAIGWVNPIAEMLAGKNEKLKTDLAGYLVNAVTTGATTLEGVRANVLGLIQQYGFDEASMRAAIDEMLNSGEITPEQREAYQYGIGTLMLGDPTKYEYSTPGSGQVVNVGDGGVPQPAPPTPTNRPPTDTMLQPPSSVPPPVGAPTPVTRSGMIGNLSSNILSQSLAPPAPLPQNAQMNPALSAPAPIPSDVTPAGMPGRVEEPVRMRPLMPSGMSEDELRIRPIGLRS